MPSVGSHIDDLVYKYDSPARIPEIVWDAWRALPEAANIMLSCALKALDEEHIGYITPDQFWIVCGPKGHGGPLSVNFVLSCTEGPLGSYPIFIFCANPDAASDERWMRARIEIIADALHRIVNPSRVYSIFAPQQISLAFSEAWSELTGIASYEEPYYLARMSSCTRNTFINRQFTIQADMNITYELRLAEERDIPAAAVLCYGFAATSEPFVLTMEQAFQEASMLISKGQLWVHTISRPNLPEEIASIVAVTRESESCAAITKVFTNIKWRSRRCAERLVRRVCKHLLIAARKESVVLYVAHNNPAANKVYHRVGFAGLDPKRPVADPWLEIGFDRTAVALGHW